MMKNISKIFLAVLVCLCLMSTALAAPLDRYEINDTTESVTIYGSVDGAKYLDRITVEVLKPGVEISRDEVPTKESIKNDFIHITQLLADRNGEYSLTIDMSGNEAAFYSVKVNGELGEKQFFFATTSKKNEELGAIKIICNTPNQTVAVRRLLATLDTTNPQSTTINMFGVSDSLVREVDAEKLATVFYNLVRSNSTYLDTPAGLKKGIETATHLVAVNDGKGDCLTYGEEFGASEELQKIYAEELSSSVKAAFISDNFKGKNIVTLAEAKAAYEKGVLLGYLASVDAISDVEVIIENYGEEIGVDMKDYDKLKSTEKTKLHEYLAEKSNLTTFEAFAKAANDKIKDILDGRKDSSGGGVGGGGFGGGSSGNIVSGGTPGYSPIIATDISANFNDMAGYEWAREAVDTLFEKGMVSGVAEKTFAPGREITREEMVAMLIRALGIDVTAVEAELPFTDVDASAWYAPYIKVAYANGYVSGVSDTEFGTGRVITREEAATMTNRIALSMGKEFSSESEAFTDDSAIAEYAKQHVYALKNAGIINGIGDGSFAPKNYCNRSQAAVIIYTLINK